MNFTNKNLINYLRICSFVVVFIFGFLGLTKNVQATSIVGGNCTVSPGQTSCNTSITANTNGLPTGWVGQLYYYNSKTGVAILDSHPYSPNDPNIFSSFLTDVGYNYQVTLVTHDVAWTPGQRQDYGPVVISANPSPAPSGVSLSGTACTVTPPGTSCYSTIDYSVINNGWDVWIWDNATDAWSNTTVSGSGQKTATIFESPGTNIALYYWTGNAPGSGTKVTLSSIYLSALQPIPPPTVTTNTATSITSNSATLNGSANPNGVSANGYFRYGTSNPGTCSNLFGTRIPSSGGTTLSAGNGVVNYSSTAVGLTGGTTYYYCAFAENSNDVGVGGVVSFTASNTVSSPVIDVFNGNGLAGCGTSSACDNGSFSGNAVVGVSGTYSVAAHNIDGRTYSYIFDWGDGTQLAPYSTGACSSSPCTLFQAPHTYASVGTYTITVTAVSIAGNSYSDTASATITVASAGITLHIDCCNDTTFNETDHPWNIYTIQNSTRYKITGGPVNAYVLWSSYKDGVNTGEQGCYYGQQLNTNGDSGTILGSVWSLFTVGFGSNIGAWQKTVSFTMTQPAVSSCGNTPNSSLGSASAYFSVENNINVGFNATMNNGINYNDEVLLTGGGAPTMHFNLSAPYTAWYNRNTTSGTSYFLQSQYWSAQAPDPSTFGYSNAALFGFSCLGGGNIAVGLSNSNQYVGYPADPSYCNNIGGIASFDAHYRNTRIAVKAVDANGNSTALGGTYTITPASGTVPISPSNATIGNNGVYYGMTAGQPYTITYTPGAGESVSNITTALFLGGWPIENPNGAPQITAGNSATGWMIPGGLVIFIIKVASPGQPSLSAKWKDNNDTTYTKTVVPGMTYTIDFNYWNSGAKDSVVNNIQCSSVQMSGQNVIVNIPSCPSGPLIAN